MVVNEFDEMQEISQLYVPLMKWRQEYSHPLMINSNHNSYDVEKHSKKAKHNKSM